MPSHEERDVLAATPERRHLDRHDAEAIEEVLAELARGDRLLEGPVGRGDDAHVDLLRGDAADRLEAAVLEDAQELHLELRAHLPDLVEEDRAAVGELEAADRGSPSRR